MRRQRSDSNQKELVALYRQLGCSVLVLSMTESIDLLVGVVGVNDLVEIKDGDKPLSARKLTKEEADFQDEWKGRKVVNVKSTEEVIAHVERLRGKLSKAFELEVYS
jgi:hypothetical protein